jgi:hypothetical protein
MSGDNSDIAWVTKGHLAYGPGNETALIQDGASACENSVTIPSTPADLEMAMVEADTMRRLALIRYQCQLAIDHSYQPEPISSLSVLGFHDAVELFLSLGTELHNVGKTDRPLMQCFDVINQKIAPSTLAQSIQSPGFVTSVDHSNTVARCHPG